MSDNIGDSIRSIVDKYLRKRTATEPDLDFSRDVENATKDLTSLCGWINTETRLPETPGKYRAMILAPSNYYKGTVYFNGKSFTSPDLSRRIFLKVTHWAYDLPDLDPKVHAGIGRWLCCGEEYSRHKDDCPYSPNYQEDSIPSPCPYCGREEEAKGKKDCTVGSRTLSMEQLKSIELVLSLVVSSIVAAEVLTVLADHLAKNSQRVTE